VSTTAVQDLYRIVYWCSTGVQEYRCSTGAHGYRNSTGLQEYKYNTRVHDSITGIQ
jgi:hypothetical protein